jgi:hypothetical protein
VVFTRACCFLMSPGWENKKEFVKKIFWVAMLGSKLCQYCMAWATGVNYESTSISVWEMTESESQMASYSLDSALLLTKVHSALCMEYSVIWHVNVHFSKGNYTSPKMCHITGNFRMMGMISGRLAVPFQCFNRWAPTLKAFHCVLYQSRSFGGDWKQML